MEYFAHIEDERKQSIIHNLDGTLLMEKLGAKRVVLARETSIDTIKLIKEKSDALDKTIQEIGAEIYQQAAQAQQQAQQQADQSDSTQSDNDDTIDADFEKK